MHTQQSSNLLKSPLHYFYIYIRRTIDSYKNRRIRMDKVHPVIDIKILYAHTIHIVHAYENSIIKNMKIQIKKSYNRRIYTNNRPIK